jgi:ribosome biogenesis GTPase
MTDRNFPGSGASRAVPHSPGLEVVELAAGKHGGPTMSRSGSTVTAAAATDSAEATSAGGTAEAGLTAWGWDGGWAGAFAASGTGELAPGRVIAQHRGLWLLATGDRESPASLTGRFRHLAEDGDLPAVGDWVGCVPSAHEGAARIDAILPRRSAFVRRAAGSRVAAQVVAANIDVLFVATSLNADLNSRRLERYVVMGRESGAEPVVLLTKADLSPDAEARAERLSSELRVSVVALSAHTGQGVNSVAQWFRAGRTLALVGSSGVGKSTLLNRLAGEELMATREIREDDSRGRHTTSHRELFRLPGGALLLDTPGMRELGLWDADEAVDEAFADLADLASRCRFADCSHRLEPGCAIQAAVAGGRLDQGRVKSYRRLFHELAEQPTSAAARREKDRRFGKMVRRAAADSTSRKAWRGGDY